MHIGKQKWIQKQLKKYAKYILEKTYLIDDIQKYILTFLYTPDAGLEPATSRLEV